MFRRRPAPKKKSILKPNKPTLDNEEVELLKANYRFTDYYTYFSLAVLAYTAIYIGVYYRLNVFSNPYFKFGPNETFLFLGAKVDNWNTYLLLLLLQLADSFFNFVVFNMVYPWIATDVQARSRKVYPAPKWKTYFIVNVNYMHHQLKNVFWVFTALSQFDLALANLLTYLFITNSYTIRSWINHKYPDLKIIRSDDDEEEE